MQPDKSLKFKDVLFILAFSGLYIITPTTVGVQTSGAASAQSPRGGSGGDSYKGHFHHSVLVGASASASPLLCSPLLEDAVNLSLLARADEEADEPRACGLLAFLYCVAGIGSEASEVAHQLAEGGGGDQAETVILTPRWRPPHSPRPPERVKKSRSNVLVVSPGQSHLAACE